MLLFLDVLLQLLFEGLVDGGQLLDQLFSLHVVLTGGRVTTTRAVSLTLLQQIFVVVELTQDHILEISRLLLILLECLLGLSCVALLGFLSLLLLLEHVLEEWN